MSCKIDENEVKDKKEILIKDAKEVKENTVYQTQYKYDDGSSLSIHSNEKNSSIKVTKPQGKLNNGTNIAKQKYDEFCKK